MLAAASLAGTATAAPDATAELAEEDLVILEVKLDKFVLGDALLAYLRPGGLLLPLGELSELLDFAILVDAHAGHANGWFIRESRQFHLDLAKGEAVIDGLVQAFDTGLVQRDLTEIYVDSSLLSRWFGIEFELKLSYLQLRLHARQKLPVQLRLLRDEVRLRSLSGRGPKEQLPRRDSPYRMASWPSLDLVLQSATGSDGTQSSYSVLGAADLAGVSTKVRVSGSTSEAVSILRLLASRTNADAGLLGPVGARRIEFGDVTTPPVPLVSRGHEGPGLYISNGPLVQPDEFGVTSVRGDAPDGWEVELYHNGSLIDFQIVDASNRYEFPRVEIGYGENVLRSVVYGPQGQIREHIERLPVGQNMLRPGQLQYRAFAVRPERTLLDGWIDSLRDTSGSDAWDLHGQLAYGISRSLSVSAGLTSTEINGSDDTFATVGVRASSLGSFSEAEVARNDRGGTALRLSTQTRVFGQSALLQQSFFRDYETNLDPGALQPEDKTLLRLSGSFAPPRIPTLTYSLRYERQGFQRSGTSDRSQLSLRLATNVRGVSFAHELNLGKSGGVASPPRRVWSMGLISGRMRGLQLRGRIQYEWKPEPQLEAVSASVSRRLRKNMNTSLGLTRTLTGSRETSLTGRLSWLGRKLEVSLELTASSEHGLRGGIRIGSSFAREPQSGRFLVNRRRMAASASATARVFLDRNANDVFDSGDEPIPDVEFIGNSAWQETQTDADGRAFLTGVPVHRPQDLRIDPASLIDPFWVPSVPGYAVVGHGGGTVELDFPIRLAGEIDGTVYLDREGELWPRPNVKLELVDSHAAVVQTIRSSFDGYFLFEGVFPEHYRIRVAENAIRDPEIVADELDLELSADGGVVSGLELILRTRSAVQPEPRVEPMRAAKSSPIAEPELQVEDRPLGPICGPLARMLLRRAAWAPRGSREVGECLRARRGQARKANEPPTGTAKTLEPPAKAGEDRDDGDLTEPPLETTHAPESNQEAPELDLWMGIFDLRAGSPLAHEQIIIALADTVGGRELARLSPLPEQPASGRAERAECAQQRQTRSDRTVTRSCGTPPASPLPRGPVRARGPPAPDPTPRQQTSALAESVATSWKDGARAPPADPSSRGSRSPPKG